MQFPYSDAASIIRAHQKDAYIISTLKEQLEDVLRVIKGSRFVSNNSSNVDKFVNLLYLSLTTLIGTRTLGEEYCDIFYVNSNGSSLPSSTRRGLFVICSVLAPVYITKVAKKWGIYDKLADIPSVHLALFYCKGAYYDVYKRLFGMRYAFGHQISPMESTLSSNSYEVLGALLSIRLGASYFSSISDYIVKSFTAKNSTHLTSQAQLELQEKERQEKQQHLTLDDAANFAFIPAASRNCTLCLSPMTDPTATVCGHLFCWECVSEWCRESSVCPLCRQDCKEQNLLVLRQ